MYRDDTFSIYACALAASVTVLGLSWMLTPPQIDVANLSVDAIETGAIETSSIPVETLPDRALWGAPAIPWRSYESGLREMADTGRTGVLVLQADWCLVCRNYQKLFLEEDVQQYSEDVVFILADIDKNPELQTKFNVDGDYIPRTFLLDPDGGLAAARTGGHQQQRFFVDPFKSDELSVLLQTAVEQP